MSDDWQQIGAPASEVAKWVELCHELRNVIEPRIVAGKDAMMALDSLACVMAYVVSLVDPRHHARLGALLQNLPNKIMTTAGEAREQVGGADVRDHMRKFELKLVKRGE